MNKELDESLRRKGEQLRELRAGMDVDRQPAEADALRQRIAEAEASGDHSAAAAAKSALLRHLHANT